jgi:hypothetical protein
MPEMRSFEWQNLCLKALNETRPEGRKAVVLALSRM